ncbi:MAG: DUF6775 family putative metallopeptidase [Candidatus Geothermincolia bacterium]
MGSSPGGVLDIFDSAGSAAVSVELLGGFASGLMPGLTVRRHGDFVEFCMRGLEPEARADLEGVVAVEIASARVTDITGEAGREAPSHGMVEYERRMLRKPPPRPAGVLYDGYRLSQAYGTLASRAPALAESRVIIVTNQLFGTRDETDSRYHARVSIYGFPTLISTTGLLEAPAKPRSYYLEKAGGRAADRLEADYAGEFLSRDDERTNEVLKSYVTQALFYWKTGEPFCDDSGCSLYNAHWQRELLGEKSDGARELCDKHAGMLAGMTMEADDG